MTTTLQLYCKFKGQQGGTIHQAQREFARMDIRDKDKFCSLLMRNLAEISDIEHARWFTNARINHIS